MKKNFIRIIVGAWAGIAVFTALLILVEKNVLVYTAYIWSVFALIVFAVGIGYWATGRKTAYILHAAYPLLLKGYTFTAILAAVIFGGLSCLGIWTMPWGWFCLLEFVLLVFTAWKIQALDAGKDAIMAVEESVKVNTVSWKMLTVNINTVAGRAATDNKTDINRAMEAIRFADPMEHAAVAGITEKIDRKITELGAAVDSNESGQISEICAAIEQLVKERAAKLMIVK